MREGDRHFKAGFGRPGFAAFLRQERAAVLERASGRADGCAGDGHWLRAEPGRAPARALASGWRRKGGSRSPPSVAVTKAWTIVGAFFDGPMARHASAAPASARIIGADHRRR
jgi:hypothetical protein